MTQLLDPSGPYECIWDDEVPCELVLINTDMTDQELMAFIFSNEFPPMAAIPLPPTFVMLLASLVLFLVFRLGNRT